MIIDNQIRISISVQKARNRERKRNSYVTKKLLKKTTSNVAPGNSIAPPVTPTDPIRAIKTLVEDLPNYPEQEDNSESIVTEDPSMMMKQELIEEDLNDTEDPETQFEPPDLHRVIVDENKERINRLLDELNSDVAAMCSQAILTLMKGFR